MLLPAQTRTHVGAETPHFSVNDKKLTGVFRTYTHARRTTTGQAVCKLQSKLQRHRRSPHRAPPSLYTPYSHLGSGRKLTDYIGHTRIQVLIVLFSKMLEDAAPQWADLNHFEKNRVPA